jgi:hypothetical protein
MSEYQSCNFFGAYAKIYTLSDDLGNVFYVGCTVKRLEVRLAQHISNAKLNKKYGNKRKDEHIRSLNYKITATIVDMLWVTAQREKDLKHKADNLERKWIQKYASLGYDLCNGRYLVTSKNAIQEPEYIGKAINVTSGSDNVDKPKFILRTSETDHKE